MHKRNFEDIKKQLKELEKDYQEAIEWIKELKKERMENNNLIENLNELIELKKARKDSQS